MGKILPTCASFNGVDQYVYNGSSSPFIKGGVPLSIKIIFKPSSFAALQYLLNCGAQGVTAKGFSLTINTSGNLIFSSAVGGGSSIAAQTISSLSLNTAYTLELSWNGQTGGTLNWILNGNSGSGTTTKAWSEDSTYRLFIACRQSAGNPATTVANFFSGGMSYVMVNDGTVNYELHLSGKGKYAYSTDGNYVIEYRNGASIATATIGGSSTYNEIGSIYPMDYGYKIYKKDGMPDEYVPYGGKISHLTGYTTTSQDTFEGNTKTVNMWPCYIDFDYSDEGGSAIELFDRSNVTRCTDLARGALYDSSNHYRWHISELADPRVYFEYFNDGYAGMLFGKVTTELYESNYYIKDLLEVLVYTTDKKGSEQWSVMLYCGINVFAI